MRSAGSFFLSGCIASAFAGGMHDAGTLPPGSKRAQATITPEAIASSVRFLSDDLLEGRGPASRGDGLARLYIAAVLESLGYQPGAPGGVWEQSFGMIGLTSGAPAEWTFSRGGKNIVLKRADDFIAFTGRQAESSSISDAELVFVGYGIEAPEHGWDDFKGRDLRGKVLVVLNNDPDWDPSLFAGKRRLYYGRWDYKFESAARQGAAGALIIHTRPSAGYPWKVVQTSWGGEQFELPAGGEPRLEVGGWISEKAADDLARLAGRDLEALVASARRRDFQPVPLGVRTSVILSNALREVRTANVLGLLPGRDPALRKEVVVLSAHHDHLGIGEPDASGDRIYNGALDNAAGVGQLLAIARALAALPEPPRRSVLIAALAAEEQGLLGSAWYARHPTFPAGRIAANVNFDGGNIWGQTLEIPLIGLGKSSLDRTAEQAAKLLARSVVDEPFPDRGFFYRSDQFNFARIGVPAIYFDTATRFVGRPEGWGKEAIEGWESSQYHQPSDEFGPEWNLDGMVDDARFGFLATLLIAESDAMPTWNAGDEFEAVRKRALDEAAKLGPTASHGANAARVP